MNFLIPLLLSMSGPVNALVRYGATSAGTLLASKGWIAQSDAQLITGALLALAPAVIGALTSTVQAKIAATTALPQVSAVRLVSGVDIDRPGDVTRAQERGQL